MTEVRVNESLELIRKNWLEFALRSFRPSRASGRYGSPYMPCSGHKLLIGNAKHRSPNGSAWLPR